MFTATSVSPPVSLKRRLDVPRRLLLGPGPSNCPDRILKASSSQMLGHLDEDFLKVMEDTKEGIKYVFQTRNEYTFAVSGTGHCAMETAIINLLDKDGILLCLINGIWGERAMEIGRRIGARCEALRAPIGGVITIAELSAAMSAVKPTVLFVCHGESSTGVLQPLEGIGKVCHENDCILIVDAVASLGASPLSMDSYGIDVLYSTSQKVLNAPPGISPISFSPKAIKKVRETSRKSFYLDVLLIGNYWNCDDKKINYHHTAPVSLVYALREALSILAEETIEKSWYKHHIFSEKLQMGLQDMGLELLVSEKNYRLPTITAVKIPANVDCQKVIQHMRKRHNIDIAGGLGPTAGLIWRIGLMGSNCTLKNVQVVLKGMEEALKEKNMSKL